MSWDAAFAADLDAAAKAGAAKQPATLTEMMGAEWEAAGLSTTFGLTKPYQDAVDELGERVGALAGRPIEQLAAERGGPNLYSLPPRRRGAVVAEIARGLPEEQQAGLGPFLDLDARARQKAQATEARAAEIGARSYGLTGTALGFAVGAARQAVDPLNLVATGLTAPFGGAGGMGLGAFLGREFAVNAAVQAAQEPFIQTQRADLGLEAGWSQAAQGVLMAGAGGAGLAGLLRGGAAVWRRFGEAPPGPARPDAVPQAEQPAMSGGGRKPPPDLSPEDLDAAARAAERDQVLDEAAHEPSPEGRLRSAEATDEAAEAIEAGRGPAAMAETEPDGPVVHVPARRANAPRHLSINQFIARNGGLELTGDALAADLDKLFVPGGGRLARERGRSIDGYWRERLIEEGYLPPDEEGGVARDIRAELFEAIRRDRTGDRVWRAIDQDEINAAPRKASNYEREVERQARAIRKQFAGMYPDGIDDGVLYRAAEDIHRGYETDPLLALDRAFVEAERRGSLREAPPDAAREPDVDIPFFDEPHEPGHGAAGARDEAGSGGGGGDRPGPPGAARGPGGDRPDPGGTARGEGAEPGLPGLPGVSERRRLEAEGARPLRGGDAAPPAGGLFDPDARAQTDLVQAVAAARRADVERALEAAGGDMQVTIVGPDGSETKISARELLRQTEASGRAADELYACILKGGRV